MAKHNDDVVSITRAIRANRIARAQSTSGPHALSRTGSADTSASNGGTDTHLGTRNDGDDSDMSMADFGVDDLEPKVFGTPESIAQATAGANPMAKQLVEDHLWLVDRLAGQAARRFPRYVERNELWSAGVLGLVEAARRYDSSYNVPFAAYASARVRGEMLETARSADLAPRRLRRSLRELAEVVETLTQTLGRVPSLAEVAEEAKIDVAVVRDRLQTAANLVSSSLDDSAGSSASDSALATVATEPTEKLTQQEMLGALREAVAQLPEPLKSVLVRSHWNNERLVDIAEDMGISFQRVAQYKVEAITALAAWFATLYEAVPSPDAGLPGAVRRAAFCSSLAARSTWKTRLEAGAGRRDDSSEQNGEDARGEVVGVLSGFGAGVTADS